MINLTNLTKNLHNDHITQINLTKTIHFELKNIHKTNLLNIKYITSNIKQNLNNQKSIMLFHIFQKNLNNILKHSKTKQVEITLTYLDDKFIIQIMDNKINFDINTKKKSTSSTTSIRLKSIFNHAKLIKTTIDIKSTPKHGTSVTIQIPLPSTKSK